MSLGLCLVRSGDHLHTVQFLLLPLDLLVLPGVERSLLDALILALNDLLVYPCDIGLLCGVGGALAAAT